MATLAAGAALTGVDHTLAGNGPALALVRPPGHHAERDRAMGFCLFNNVAVAAAYARARGVGRVAIVDFDVHHGNGTQWMFYADPDVLYVSTHQFPYYPGTGAASEVGHGRGAGRTLNVPLEAGRDRRRLRPRVSRPASNRCWPSSSPVCCSCRRDSTCTLATRWRRCGCRRPDAAGWSRRSGASAGALCGGRLVAVTEGGYDLQALGECLDATVDVLAADPGADTPARWPPGSRTEPGRRAARARPGRRPRRPDGLLASAIIAVCAAFSA